MKSQKTAEFCGFACLPGLASVHLPLTFGIFYHIYNRGNNHEDIFLEERNYSHFLNLWWNPAKNEQAEDRLHRKGQTDQVLIHVIQAEASVDALIAQICKDKQEMTDGIMESEEIRPAIEWAALLLGIPSSLLSTSRT